MELLNRELMAGVTVLHLGIGLFVLLVVLLALQSFKRSRQVDTMHIEGGCGACGWKGRVSKFRPRCPSCGGEIR